MGIVADTDYNTPAVVSLKNALVYSGLLWFADIITAPGDTDPEYANYLFVNLTQAAKNMNCEFGFSVYTAAGTSAQCFAEFKMDKISPEAATVGADDIKAVNYNDSYNKTSPSGIVLESRWDSITDEGIPVPIKTWRASSLFGMTAREIKEEWVLQKGNIYKLYRTIWEGTPYTSCIMRFH